MGVIGSGLRSIRGGTSNCGILLCCPRSFWTSGRGRRLLPPRTSHLHFGFHHISILRLHIGRIDWRICRTESRLEMAKLDYGYTLWMRVRCYIAILPGDYIHWVFSHYPTNLTGDVVLGRPRNAGSSIISESGPRAEEGGQKFPKSGSASDIHGISFLIRSSSSALPTFLCSWQPTITS